MADCANAREAEHATRQSISRGFICTSGVYCSSRKGRKGRVRAKRQAKAPKVGSFCKMARGGWNPHSSSGGYQPPRRIPSCPTEQPSRNQTTGYFRELEPRSFLRIVLVQRVWASAPLRSRLP